jgi:hypothetical protein
LLASREINQQSAKYAREVPEQRLERKSLFATTGQAIDGELLIEALLIDDRHIGESVR